LRHQLTLGHAEILFLPHEERIVILRSGSSDDEDVNTDTEHGKHTLFQTVNGWEKLELYVLYDRGILEVFANERFALSTRLYGGPCSLEVESEGDVGEMLLRSWKV
jgi:beta-fructofuranosidase